MQNSNKRAFEIINSKTKIYLIIIAILLAVICCYEIVFIMPAVILFGFICFYAIRTNNIRKALYIKAQNLLANLKILT